MIKRNVKSISAARKVIRKMFGEVEENRIKNYFDIGKGAVGIRVVYDFAKKVKRSKRVPFGLKYVARYIPFKKIIVTGRDMKK